MQTPQQRAAHWLLAQGINPNRGLRQAAAAPTISSRNTQPTDYVDPDTGELFTISR